MMPDYEIVVVGASAGGMHALKEILSNLDRDFAFPVVVVQHLAPDSENYLVQYLDEYSSLSVKEASEKQRILPYHVYLAPPNYHLLIEEDKTFSLTVSEKVNFSRPSIDVLFETAVLAYQNRIIGLLLTGASQDGAKGMQMLHATKGLTIVQDPDNAFVPVMPKAAIELVPVDYKLTLEEIAPFLNTLSRARTRRKKQKR
ncbi:MAG: chemotaxis protein CheB [Bacteroidales bacterium]|nr:chemotaxis protein CheB [Bacteroidales bacterium]MCF8333611.1 chemotaxis protein CheB [Bacteroidales bacterium]